MDLFRHLPQFPIEILYGILAVFGGCARYLNSFIDGQGFSFRVFLASAFVAGFSGYMFALLGETMNLPAPMPSILAGTGGFFGEQTMKLVLEYAQSKIA